MSKESVSVIIPTLNASLYIEKQLEQIFRQTVEVDEVIIVDSESEDNTVELTGKYDKVRVIHVKRSEFDHGKTRDYAIRNSTGQIVILMTQDAVLEDVSCFEYLVDTLRDKKIAQVTARQLPRKDANIMERLIREFNYPDKSNVRSQADVRNMGIKTFFSSDVCAAYNKDTYFKLGGFDYPLKTNEDMFFAARVIQAGYMVAYNADAEVVHSHNFTLKQQYRRNYIQGYELENHKNLLLNVSENSEGMKLVKYVSVRLLRRGHFISFIHFGLDCCARLAGNKKGKADARKEIDNHA